MKILQIAYPFAEVSRDAAGGAEQILWMLDQAILRAGLESIVVAVEGSKVSGKLRSAGTKPETLDEAARARFREHYRACVSEAIQRERPDLVHYHGIDFDQYFVECDVPSLVTLHLPIEWYSAQALRAPVSFLCVSEAQYNSKPEGLTTLGWIENGVDLHRLGPRVTKRKYAFTMGRVCEEKALHIAMEAATGTGTFLLMGGALFAYPDHIRYYHQEIEPRLDPSKNRFLGTVGFNQKRRLLAGARCFLQTSQASETSSLTVMEALASGTPVVACPSGAVPTLIEEGRTGFLARDAKEMAKAMSHVDELNPEACKRVARERFSSERMTSEYLHLYRRLAGSPSVIPSSMGFENRWRELWQQSNATLFQSPEWLMPWVDHLGNPDAADFRVTQKGGTWTGLLPVQPWEGKLRLLGEGVTDYLDGIGDCELPSEPFEFCNLPPWSKLARHAVCDDPCLIVDLPTSWDDYLISLPQKLRKSIREAQGEVRLLGAEGIEELFRLHGLRWKDKGEEGVLADTRVQEFHREVARNFEREGWLRLAGLFDGATCAGIVYAFERRDRLYFYLGGFDPRYTEWSPGNVLIAYLIEHALSHGIRWADFLRGSEPYKFRWGAKEQSTYRLTSA
jgi:glycosyltransferase involved in cell wall biosynthesis